MQSFWVAFFVQTDKKATLCVGKPSINGENGRFKTLNDRQRNVIVIEFTYSIPKIIYVYTL